MCYCSCYCVNRCVILIKVKPFFYGFGKKLILLFVWKVFYNNTHTMFIQKIIIKTNLVNKFYVIDYDKNDNEFQTKIIGEWDEVEKNWTMKYYIESEGSKDSVYIMYETMCRTGEYEIEEWVSSEMNGYKYKRIYTLEKNDEGNACLIEK